MFTNFEFYKYILLFLIIFIIGIIGLLLTRRNIILLLMSIELILAALNLMLIFSSLHLDDIQGQVVSLYLLTAAAAEAAIGLALIVSYYRLRGVINIDFLINIKC